MKTEAHLKWMETVGRGGVGEKTEGLDEVKENVGN